ncbi:MAG TPA: 2-dehydropantoate 2-reductase [Vicinamibacterales bacterium]|nr:2-dehydropantoate 2-reductase [Vicinamibacterales bacterium]
MRIAIIGAGGVGGYFGARLIASGEDVTFVARGPHLAAVRASGLRVESPKGDLHLREVRATGDVDAVGEADIVLLTVKMYDLETAAAALTPLIGRNTVVVTLQNGVEAVDIVARHVGRDHVAGGVAYVAAVIAEPGLIRHTSLDTLIFGELDGRRSDRLVALEAACQRAGFSARMSERIDVDLWSKFSRLAVFSGMTAVTRSPIGVLRDDPDLLSMLQQACEESALVARARGIALPESLMDEIMQMVRQLPHHAKSSMLEDLERGRRLELPWLSGAVVRLGRESGVATPIHSFIATVLKPHVHG